MGYVKMASYLRNMRSRYPPGPWPSPSLGILYLLIKDTPRALTKLAKKYGPVYTIGRVVKPIVVLCDKQGIEDVLTKNAQHLSGRSMNTMGSQTISLGANDLYHAVDEERVALMRSLALSMMERNTEQGSFVMEIVQQEIAFFKRTVMSVEGRLIDPADILNLPIENIIMRMTLNYRFQSKSEPSYTKWTDLDLRQRNALYNSILISFLPLLWKIWPGLRKSISSVTKEYNSFLSDQLQYHLSTYKKGTTRDIMDMCIEYLPDKHANNVSSEYLTKSNILGFAKSMIGAGTESISGVIRWAFLVLLHRPCFQEKIRRELDHYAARAKVNQKDKNANQVTTELVFDYKDRHGLPYLNAFIHEVLRRWPITPLSMLRKVLVDTSVGKYIIPKDTLFFTNIHACHMDERVWEKPLDFNPERFLDVDGQFDFSKAKQLMVFNTGCRSCVGKQLVMMEVFSCLANMIHTFRLECESSDKLPSMDNPVFVMQYLPKKYKMIFRMR